MNEEEQSVFVLVSIKVERRRQRYGGDAQTMSSTSGVPEHSIK